MPPTSRSRPSWQREPCPAWCVVEHDESDLPDDRVHDSAGRSTPAVLGGPLEDEQAATELLILMSRRSGDAVDWVFVGEPERDGHGLSLSRESALHVAHEILHLASGED